MTDREADCGASEHAGDRRLGVDDAVLQQAARIFRVLGDGPRMRLVAHLARGSACVTELALAEGDNLSTVSQRLRLLLAENVVTRRRRGKHVEYALADRHVVELIGNAVGHARGAPPRRRHTGGALMSETHRVHASHDHAHGPSCGHTAVRHDGHVDYLHDGCLHHLHGDHVDEHALSVGGDNPAACTPGHACGAHGADHRHGAACGHEAVPHGDHVDYLVEGHLHHPHGGHCDDHGRVALA